MNVNKQGQLSIINIFFWLILVFLASVVAPIFDSVIQGYALTTNNSNYLIVANAIVPMFWLGVIITFFIYVTPIKPQGF